MRMYTSCPECGTVFRISASELRVAEGHVRCGSCAATFNALLSLSEAPPPTITLKQLVLVEAEQAGDAGDSPAADASLAAAPDDEPSMEFDIPGERWAQFFAAEPGLPAAAAPQDPFPGGTREAAPVAAFASADQPGPAAAAARGLRRAPEPEPEPEPDPDPEPEPEARPPGSFGAEDWETLLEEVGDEDSGEPVYVIEAQTTADAPLPGHRPDTRLPWGAQAPAAAPPAARAAPEPAPESGPEPSPEPELAPDRAVELAVAWVEAPDEPAPADLPAPLPPGAWPEADRGRERLYPSLGAYQEEPVEEAADTDGEDSAEVATGRTPHPAWGSQTTAWTTAHGAGEPEDRPARRTWAYGSGALLLALALMGQVIHHQRDDLATRPAWHDPLMQLYGAIGQSLYPSWNLAAYEVRGSEAVVGRSSASALDISARIGIVGTEPVGLPLVRVTLRDRRANPVGSGVFEPAEYLGTAHSTDAMLEPGSMLPVRLSLADPGMDASGYEVDVCIRTRRQGLRCQREREPFRQ